MGHCDMTPCCQAFSFSSLYCCNHEYRISQLYKDCFTWTEMLFTEIIKQDLSICLDLSCVLKTNPYYVITCHCIQSPYDVLTHLILKSMLHTHIWVNLSHLMADHQAVQVCAGSLWLPTSLYVLWLHALTSANPHWYDTTWGSWLQDSTKHPS